MQFLNSEAYEPADGEDISMKYLTFQVSGQHYGISIRNVIEIVQIQPTTPLPELPPYAKGVINLRGRVIPLIDVNLRFGKPEKEYDSRTCIIIVDIDTIQVGFIVDAVEEVRDIPGERISPPPQFSADIASRYITGIGKLEDYMVLILDSRLIFSDRDIDMLGAVSGE